MKAKTRPHSRRNLNPVDRENYIRVCLDDAQWIDVAEGLVKAAMALQPQVDELWKNLRTHARDKSVSFISDVPHRIQLMMFSFAVENLMKAFLIRERKDEYMARMRAKPKLPNELKTHDLVKLATVVGEMRPRFKLAFDRDREELLRRLTRRATWSGRYPVPLDYTRLTAKTRFRDGTFGILSYKMSSDPQDAVRLVNELSLVLELRQPMIANRNE